MKTHSIKRQQLKEIYNVVCDDWKNKITEVLLWESGDVINIQESSIIEGLEQASQDQKKVILKHFKIEQPMDLFSVKSYAELCKVTKTKELTLKDFAQFDNADQMLAFHQIKTIERLYNNGWKANFKNSDQSKYYPYFTVNSGGDLVFYFSSCRSDVFFGFVGLYKDQKTSDFVGKTFTDIYKQVI